MNTTNGGRDDAARRRDALTIFQAAVDAADPERCVHGAVQLDGNVLRVAGAESPYDLSAFSRICVVGAGKATPAMAAAVEDILCERITSGAINTKYGHTAPRLRRIATTECAHPVPDQAGVEGTARMIELLEAADEDSLVICLFSGGGSALMPAPVAGISLTEKQETTQQLLACGATIEEINTIRKHLSQVKGGRTAKLAAPATVISLAISDVIGDRLDTIASGPVYPDPTTYGDCLEIFSRFGLLEQLPPKVLTYLKAGDSGDEPETAGPDDPAFARCVNLVVGNISLSIEAARMAAVELGYEPLILSSRIAGETREVAAVHAAIAKEAVDLGRPACPPACIISGGETTVTLKGSGKGGRNQEFALAAAIELDGWDGITALSGGTDGTDGPTDAAGAITDGKTVTRATELGMHPTRFLNDNDSYHFFSALDDLVITGPTGTNVMDLRLFLIT